MEMAGMDSQGRLRPIDLWDTIPDARYTTRTGATHEQALPKPGDIRKENAIPGTGPYRRAWAEGQCEFRWCLNRSGGTLAQFSLVSRPAAVTAQTATGGTVNTITDTGLTADELVHALVVITDDNGGANAAPEDEWAYIVANTTTTIHFQPDMTVAPANADVYAIYFPYNIEAAAVGDDTSEVQGVVISPDGIADNYWGWVGYKGRFGAGVEAALVQDQAIIAGTGLIDVSGTSTFDLIIGWAPFATQGAAPQALVELNCGPARLTVSA
jgi:hypothetical protein